MITQAAERTGVRVHGPGPGGQSLQTTHPATVLSPADFSWGASPSGLSVSGAYLLRL